MGLDDFRIVDTTLREGEQLAGAFFTTEQKVDIARRLDAFGVDVLELTSPVASRESRADCERIASLGLEARVAAHVRCLPADVRVAIDAGVAAVHVVIGTSALLRRHSHGKEIPQIVAAAVEVVELAKAHGLAVRLSSEDTFRSELVDLLTLYRAARRAGADRVGIADTVGVAHPFQVYELVRVVASAVGGDIEFHGHNDTGCAVANAYCALDAGATHVDTTVLGIGERNGITPLGGLLARLYCRDRDAVRRRFDLPALAALETAVAAAAGIAVPFNNCVTGPSAFTHRAGIHAKAVLRQPATYEVLDPADFGLCRAVELGHRLTGWNALAHRAAELGVPLTEPQARAVTARLKELADQRRLAPEEVDELLRSAAAAAAVPGVAAVGGGR